MSEDGSDPPRPKKLGLEDTQEMERIRTLGVEGQAERVDPWNDVTPADPSGLADDGHEASGEYFIGDGPFAAPVIGSRAGNAGAPVAANQSQPSDRIPEERAMRIADPRSPSAISRFALATQPVVVQRNTKSMTPQARSQSGIRIGDAAVAIARRVPSGVGRPDLVRAHHPVPSQEPPPSRRYEKMRALLKNPEKIPYGSAKPKPPPVPGTFIPAGKREKEPPPAPSSPMELDQMLATMAEGLLIGEDASGHTEVRVTLRDEFFAGTELRIKIAEGGVQALLVPPDRSTYMTLNGNIDDLRIRLESRGLRVSQIRVAEP